jgi:hypothetical protein
MAIISCPNCGNSVSSEASFCIHCNNPITKKQETATISQPLPYNTPTGTSVGLNIPSVGDWIVTFLILSIPVVNLIVLLIWAFSNDTNPIKANFSKAALIWIIILIFFYIIFFGAIIAAMFS